MGWMWFIQGPRMCLTRLLKRRRLPTIPALIILSPSTATPCPCPVREAGQWSWYMRTQASRPCWLRISSAIWYRPALTTWESRNVRVLSCSGGPRCLLFWWRQDLSIIRRTTNFLMKILTPLPRQSRTGSWRPSGSRSSSVRNIIRSR